MRLVVTLCVLISFAKLARADDKPWATGVSEENQKAAFVLYDDANKSFAQAEYKPALETYSKALALWDHPQIRYNIAVCLINLDHPVEALDNLEHAMQYGQAAIGVDLWNQGQIYKKLLAARVAEIQVDADQGSSISLDGKPLTVAQQRVLSGDHQIVVEKPTYQTETRTIRVNGGDHVTIKIELKPVAVARTLHRRWSRWLPYTVLSVGVAAAIVGIPMLVASGNAYDRYDAAVTKNCPNGCIDGQPSGDAVKSKLDTAKLENNAAFSLFVGGAAIAATGFFMVIANTPRLVTPMIGTDHVGLALSGRF